MFARLRLWFLLRRAERRLAAVPDKLAARAVGGIDGAALLFQFIRSDPVFAPPMTAEVKVKRAAAIDGLWQMLTNPQPIEAPAATPARAVDQIAHEEPDEYDHHERCHKLQDKLQAASKKLDLLEQEPASAAIDKRVQTLVKKMLALSKEVRAAALLSGFDSYPDFNPGAAYLMRAALRAGEYEKAFSMAVEYRNDGWLGFDPETLGFNMKRIAIDAEKKRDYALAIDVCSRALSAGFPGEDWQHRINRCSKRSGVGSKKQ